MAKKLAALVMILVVAGLGAFLYYYVKNPGSVEITNNNRSTGILGYSTFTYDESGELSATGITQLDISGISADISINFEDVSVISAHFHGNISLLPGSPEPHLTIASAGGRATIEVEPRGVSSYRIGFGDLKLDVVMPSSMNATLKVKSVSGKIVIKDAGRFNSAELDTVSGSINAGSMTVDGHYKANTVSGSINVGRIAASSFSANSVSASLNAAEVAGANTIKMDSVSGRVTLGLPADAQFDIKANSVSGSVSCAFPVIIESSTSRKLVGRVGSGDTNIDITTVSGSISIEKR